MDITKFQFGLEIIEGLPGAGKSFYATRRVIRVIKTYQRPVYTNLPLKFKVVRKYLRICGGEELANLIRPLKEDHWRRFLSRQHAYARFKEQRAGHPSNLPEEAQRDLCECVGKTIEQLHNQQQVTPDQMVQWFEAKVGPPIYEGHQADSIPLSAIIVIDEVQHWHPMIKQGNADGREELQAYLTMMRHHLHWIWVITQDRTRIDIIFRRMCKSVWQVWDRGEDRLAFGIRFRHLGFRAMGFRRYTPEQLEGTNRDNIKPSENIILWPTMPWHQIYFRFYTSWTQAGSKRQITKMLRTIRDKAGVTEQSAKRKKKLIMRRPKFITKLYTLIHRGMVATAFIALGIVLANINTQPKENQTRDIPEPTTQANAPKPHNWPTYDGFAGTNPILSGSVTPIGSVVGDRGRLVFIDSDNRSCVLVADDGYWLWEYLADRPHPVGPVDQIRAAYQRLKDADDAGGRSVEDARTNTSETVGT